MIHQSEKESSGKYTFAAPSTGIHTVCFNNEKSSMTPKVVMFSIEVGETPHRVPGAPGEEDAGHTKLEDMIRELSGTLTSVKHEQEYMHVRFFLLNPFTASALHPTTSVISSDFGKIQYFLSSKKKMTINIFLKTRKEKTIGMSKIFQRI